MIEKKNNSRPVRVRFAPSPTGKLHIGNLRTALFNWLYARKYGGKFILRIDDTDLARTVPGSEQEIYQTLRWLELDWDEGPVGYQEEKEVGDYAPYRQSARLTIYRSYLDRLVEQGKAYPCFCTEEELEQERELARKLKRAYRYSGKCRNLKEEERKARIKGGKKYSLRLRTEPMLLKFKDLIRGELQTHSKEIGDFIICRADGIPTYNFTCVVDDYLMEISLVMRAEDHLHNTFAQLLVYQALGFEPPSFAHVPLILNKNRKPLSKREQASSVRFYQEKGYLPQALLNYLALLGFSHPEGKEILSREELIESFLLERVSKSPAVFDPSRLEWFNRKYLLRLSGAELLSYAQKYLEQEGIDLKEIEPSRLEEMLVSVRDNVRVLSELGSWLKIYLEMPEPEQVKSLLSGINNAKVVLSVLIEYLKNAGEGIDETSLKKLFPRMTKKEIYLPIRFALTGRKQGPAMRDLLRILGKEEIRQRLENAFKVLKSEAGG